MKITNATLLLSLLTNNISVTSSYTIFTRASKQLTGRALCRQSSTSYASSRAVRTRSRTLCSLAAATKEDNEQTEQSNTKFWNSRTDCWRPDVPDVEKISWGMPAKKKRTGSRGVPHRLNEEERRAFDQARRQGFLQVTGSSWRSQRSDAPLLNSYRSLMDARGRPVIVLHKLSPNSSGGVDNGDRLVVDLSPLRFPDEFEGVELELKKIVLAEFDVESQILEFEEEGNVDETDEIEILDANAKDDGDDDWETRPIYQLSPHSFSWEVSRQEGKQVGKFLGNLFDNVENKATKSKKPKGVKPGKGRRHGGYGIG